MKVKVKVSGIVERKHTSFIYNIETPDFEDKHWEFMARRGIQTAQAQAVQWIDDNYFEVIVPLAEERFMHPIGGFEVVKKRAKSKKDEVMNLAELVCNGKSDEFKAMFLGSLHGQWKTIKGLAPVKIIEITLNTINISSSVSTSLLTRIYEILDDKESQSRIGNEL